MSVLMRLQDLIGWWGKARFLQGRKDGVALLQVQVRSSHSLIPALLHDMRCCFGSPLFCAVLVDGMVMYWIGR